MKAVVLAGGKGARLAPYTKILPKPLMPIGDRPILEILALQMKKAGIDEVTLTVGHLSGILRAFFQDGSQYGLEIRYSYEDHPLGTAGPLSLIGGLDDTFLVTNGDVLTNLKINELLLAHQNSNSVATIAMHACQVKVDLGVLQINENNNVVGYIEKPTYDFNVSMGMYIFEPEVLKYIPKNEYLDFPDLVIKLLENGHKVTGFPFDGYWQDLGRPDDYEQAVEEYEILKSEIIGEDIS